MKRANRALSLFSALVLIAALTAVPSLAAPVPVRDSEVVVAGTATPASSNGKRPAVPYTTDVYSYYTDAFRFTIITTILENGQSAAGTAIFGAQDFTYTPLASHANQTTTITLNVDGNENETLTSAKLVFKITVGDVPPDGYVAPYTSNVHNIRYTPGDTRTISAAPAPYTVTDESPYSGEAVIDLDTETLTLPVDFTAKAYSLNGGEKWVDKPL